MRGVLQARIPWHSMVEFFNSFAWFFVVLCNFQPCAEWIRNHQLHPFDPAVGLTFSIFFFSMGWAGCNCTSLSWRKTEGLACCRAQFGPKTTVTIPSKPPWNPNLNHYKNFWITLRASFASVAQASQLYISYLGFSNRGYLRAFGQCFSMRKKLAINSEASFRMQ